MPLGPWSGRISAAFLAWSGRGGTAASVKPDEARAAELRRKSRAP
jgi:hypothetical protein